MDSRIKTLEQRFRQWRSYNHLWPSANYRYSTLYRALLRYVRNCELWNARGQLLEIAPYVGTGTRKLGALLARKDTAKKIYLYQPVLADENRAGNIEIGTEQEIDRVPMSLVSTHYDPGNDHLQRELEWAIALLVDDGSIAIHNVDNHHTQRILEEFSRAHRGTIEEVARSGATVFLKKTR